MRRLVLAGIVAAVAGAGLAGVARAQSEPPPPEGSAVVQYTELVPTGKGPRAPGVGKEKRGSLSAGAKEALEGASKSTADSLTIIATSSDYGAPTAVPPKTTKVPRDAPQPSEGPSFDRTLQATAVAAAPVDDGRMIGLLVAMLAIAVGGGALAVRRRGV